jgi:transposase
LVPGEHGQHQCSCPPGGPKTGPNPTDRGKSGSKYHVLIDGNGLPLVAILTAANVADTTMLEELLDAVPPIHGPLGAPRRRPAKLHADKGYDSKKNREACYRRRIIPRIARRGKESSERLGRHRWKVERTQAWLVNFRKLDPRYGRRADLHQGFLDLAVSLILWRYVSK